MTHTDVVIDLETLANTPTSLITSIGAFKFDRNVKQTIDMISDDQKFYHVIDLTTVNHKLYDVDPNTVMWWFQQSATAMGEFAKPGRTRFQEALLRLNFWFPKGAKVWGNGADFDLTILEHAYRTEKIQQPWSYSDKCCLRTLRRLYPEVRIENPDKHNALSDAIYEGFELQRILEKMQLVNY